MNSDELEILTFELKADNKIESISKAISQATSYKVFSNYSYIIIPFFDRDVYPKTDRFDQFYNLCKNNGIGILSIDFNLTRKEHTVNDVYMVLDAVKSEIINYKYASQILETNKLSICNMCNRIVGDLNIECGWKIPLDPNDLSEERILKCMKELFIEKMLKP